MRTIFGASRDVMQEQLPVLGVEVTILEWASAEGEMDPAIHIRE